MSNGGRIHPYGDCTTKDWYIKLKYSPVVFPDTDLSVYSEPDLLFLSLTPGYCYSLGGFFFFLVDWLVWFWNFFVVVVVLSNIL